VVGERHLKYSLRLDGRREVLNAIHFGGWHDQQPGPRLRLAYRLVPDDYRGGDAIQLIIECHEPA
jgi:single-stranded-DNA-specific exonuclease